MSFFKPEKFNSSFLRFLNLQKMKIKIHINHANKDYLFELKEKRKFNYEILKNLKKELFIKKISV